MLFGTCAICTIRAIHGIYGAHVRIEGCLPQDGNTRWVRELAYANWNKQNYLLRP